MEAQLNKLKIGFGKPHHDWLPVSIKMGSFVLEFKASGVLDDPIVELVRCLLFATQEIEASMSWWLEPEEYSFQFSIMPRGAMQLVISESSKSRSYKQLFHLDASFEEVVLPFWRALRKLNPSDFTGADWYPLPLEKLEKLTQLLKVRKLAS
ncbi:MAG: hypothetical protein ACRYFZ_16225 [Janthinobacterium lividum]